MYHDRQMLPEAAHVLPDSLEQHLQTSTEANVYLPAMNYMQTQLDLHRQ